jgi:predicted Zn-dependent peptidase
LADARAFFARHYLPNNAVLSVVGDVGVDEALARVERYFGALVPGEVPTHPETGVLGPLTGTEREVTAADVPAEAVYLAWRLPARGTRTFDALDLFFGVLGHGQTSRLHRALVRDQEVAESAGAASTGLIGGNSFGYAYARARAGQRLEDVEEALVAQVDRRRAKAQYERHWLHELSRADSRADALSEYTTLEGDPELVNTRMAQVEAVGSEDVAAAVTEWFGSERRATLLYRKANA